MWTTNQPLVRPSVYDTERRRRMTDFATQQKRIAALFRSTEVPSVSDKTLKIYLDYLKSHLHQPCQQTGTEDFGWEEFYVFGPGSKQEYERLKKTRASYKDTFELLNLDDNIDENYGILANVKRISDKRKFALPLADLKAKDNNSENYQLLNDFSVWFVNYR